jgi:hypothetical protein
VPEAAVDEYRDACAGEDDVDLAARAFQQPAVNAEAQAARVKEGADRALDAGVALALRAHLARLALVERRG